MTSEEEHWKPSQYEVSRREAYRDADPELYRDSPDPPDPVIIIGLTGVGGSGKSTAANLLVTEWGFHRLAFADPLKDMLRVLLQYAGYSPDTIERYINGDLKEAHCPALGTSSRYAQQALGTEWGRDRVNARLWVSLLEARIDDLLSAGVTRIVVDDVRMENEAQCIRDNLWMAQGGVWRVLPTEEARRHPPVHRSEAGLPNTYIQADLVHDFHVDALRREIIQKIITPLNLTKPEGKPWQATT